MSDNHDNPKVLPAEEENNEFFVKISNAVTVVIEDFVAKELNVVNRKLAEELIIAIWKNSDVKFDTVHHYFWEEYHSRDF